MTQMIRDKGSMIAAIVAIVIALGTLYGTQAAKNQQLADLTAEVQHLETQVQHVQNQLDQYLYTHDGH